jgi:subtilisin-like proprotein convertase family protein
VTSCTVNAAIPDDDVSGIEKIVEIFAPPGCLVVDVNVVVDIEHTYIEDLELSIKHGDTTVVLFGDTGEEYICGSENDIDVTFDDDAMNAIPEGSCQSLEGSFKPTNEGADAQPALSSFNDMEAAGSWTIKIVDECGGDQGELVSWGLVIETTCEGVVAICDPVADPCAAEKLTVVNAAASSVEGNYVPNNVVDGLPNTRWASLGPGKTRQLTNADSVPDQQWLKLDMNDIVFIDTIILEWEAAYSRSYDIKVSDDDVTWTTVSTGNNGESGLVYLSMLNARGRYIKILSYEGSPRYGISLFDVQIIGDSDEACKSPPILPPANCDGNHEIIDIASASASSREGAHWRASKAIDHDLNTRWSSAFHDNQWFAVDLGQLTTISKVMLYWENSYATEYKLQVGESSEGPWTDLVYITNSDGETDIHDGLNKVTQYLKLECIQRARNYGFSLLEFEVHGTPVCALPSNIHFRDERIGFCVDASDEYYTSAKLTRASEYNTDTVDGCFAKCLEYDTTWLRTVELDPYACYCSYESPGDDTRVPAAISLDPAYVKTFLEYGSGSVAGTSDSPLVVDEVCYEVREQPPGYSCTIYADCTTNYCNGGFCE